MTMTCGARRTTKASSIITFRITNSNNNIDSAGSACLKKHALRYKSVNVKLKYFNVISLLCLQIMASRRPFYTVTSSEDDDIVISSPKSPRRSKASSGPRRNPKTISGSHFQEHEAAKILSDTLVNLKVFKFNKIYYAWNKLVLQCLDQVHTYAYNIHRVSVNPNSIKNINYQNKTRSVYF